MNNNTYSKLNDKGLIIAGGLTCVWKENNLYFDSYFNARKVLPLQDYYIEATTQDIENFANNALFSFDDQLSFEEGLSSNYRKKIKAIQERGVLENININEIQNQANQFELELNFENGQIKIPNDKSQVKQLLKFLDEDYFITPLTNRKCVTNSKREINL